MPKGCFVIILPLDSDYKVLGYYFKDSNLNFKVTSDLFLRLTLDHEKNEYNLLQFKETIIFSYFYKFKGKLARKASGIIIGLLLNEQEKADRFRVSLKESAEAIEVFGPSILTMPKEKFEQALKDIYLENLEPLTDILKPEALKETIIGITKIMLSGGKKERRIAQELLKKVEDEEHLKISEYYEDGEEALKEQDYDKATKLFTKASQIAEELYILDIAETLKEKASFTARIPELLKQRDKHAQEARNYLKNEDFHSAYVSYKKASELSKKLLDFEKEEEYRLKSKALENFYKIDKQYKKA